MPGMSSLRQAVGQAATDFGELGFERSVQLSAHRLAQNGAALQGSVGDQWEAAAALARQRLTDARLQLRMEANAADLLPWQFLQSAAHQALQSGGVHRELAVQDAAGRPPGTGSPPGRAARPTA